MTNMPTDGFDMPADEKANRFNTLNLSNNGTPDISYAFVLANHADSPRQMVPHPNAPLALDQRAGEA